MKGQWIACGECAAPWIFGEFFTHRLKSASIDICGLGFFELYLNGNKVSGDVLNPVWSDYTLRTGHWLKFPINDRRRARVYFRRYDVLSLLKDGANELSVLLGGGFFTQNRRRAQGEIWYASRPQLWFCLTWTDETGAQHHYVSDESLRWRPSVITDTNIYFGETHDLRIPADAPLQAVEAVAAPEGEMTLQTCPPDRVIRQLQPRFLFERDGRRIYDAGENTAGWVKLTVRGQAGEEVVVRHAEELGADGRLDFTSCDADQLQQMRYLSCGEPRICHPVFSWQGFRYFDVAGPAEDFTVEVVHSDVDVKGDFRCSDETVNWLVTSYLRSRLTNMHCGVPSDCPHRERMGYTGDGQATADTDLMLLDMDLFLRKWVQDIADGQCAVSGHVQYTAPFCGGGGGPGGWGAAIVLTPWAHYRRYRDQALLAQYYPRMELWTDYMFSRMDERGLVVRGEPKGWCLGDWCTPEPVRIPEPYVNTCILARCLIIMLEAARILGRPQDDIVLRLERVQQAIHRAYYDEVTGCYAKGDQGADALALEAGLGGRDLAAKMAAHYHAEPWFDSGFLATGSVIRQLFRYGYADTALALLQNDKPGYSFAWQRAQGATTLWERWDGLDSHNHPMFGGCIESLLTHVLGIQAGDTLVIAPQLCSRLSWAEGTAQTFFGEVFVRWERRENQLHLTVRVPCEAELRLNGVSTRLSRGETRTIFSLV